MEQGASAACWWQEALPTLLLWLGSEELHLGQVTTTCVQVATTFSGPQLPTSSTSVGKTIDNSQPTAKQSQIIQAPSSVVGHCPILYILL